MINTGFRIGDRNSNEYIEWDGINLRFSITGTFYKMLQEGVLPGHGYIKVGIDYTGEAFLSGEMTIGEFCWGNVSRKEAELISDALKSEAGELTTADFHPDKVEEILKRVQIESSPDSLNN